MTHFPFRSRKALLLTSAAAGLAFTSAAHATETTPSDASFDVGADTAVEAAEAEAGNAIVVTGVRRRDEDVQTIPVAISVIDASTIEDANISQLGDFQQLVPSLKVVSFNPRNTNINIRGLGANIALTNDGLDPGVGFYIDDVFYARPGQAQFDLIDIEQIEVLRGPQGTLFGRNTTAGAINIRTRRPTYDPSFVGDVTFGDYGYHQVRGSVSGALVEDLAAFRLSFAQSNRDGFLINRFNGEEAQDLENVTVRGQLLVEPASNLSLLLIGDYAKQRQDFVLNVVADVFTTFDNGAAIPNNIIDRTTRAGRPLSVVDPFARLGDSDSPYQSDMESYGVQGTLTWDLGSAKLTSISAYRWWDWDPANDGDSTSLPVITRAQVVNRLRQFSQELRLASQDDRPLSYSLGAYYYWQTNRGTTNFDFGSAAPKWFVPAVPAAVSTAALNGFAYEGISAPETKSFALFGQSVWKVTDALQVTAGLRYTNERKEGSYDQRQTGGVPIASLPTALQTPVRNIRNNFGPEISYATKFTDNNLSGLLAVSYNVADDVLAYGSFSWGRKSPGLNLTALPNGVDPEVRPEDVTSYEVGLKASLLDRRLTANLAGFWTDITDYQTAITDQDPLNPTVFRQYIANAPKVRSRGIEADVIAAPTDSLKLTASAAYTDAYYVSFPNAPQAPERANTGQIQDLTGEVLAGVPKFTYSLAADYAAPLGEWGGAPVELYTRADYSHRSAIFTAVTNSRFSEVPGYGLVNARIGLRREDGRWDLSFWARNLIGTDYYETLGPGAFGLVTAILGAPRTVGATLRTSL
ncbi:TonB-dependent receptor [Porphyrobacter sp. SLTP]|uniref:TonB-dependent receptor n=1 Tax=Porphyrobacter sp. SLTP TaxID=2683266 RepID=UPI00141329CA|nr:TonB-dependent receptor [Porphyrobacter sp. SLTP]NBB24489.1 TonB-dependent receptor [Porphyrobacter sp. SLTP]